MWCGSLEAFEVGDIGWSQPPEAAVTNQKQNRWRSPAPGFQVCSFPWQGSEEVYQFLVTLKSKNF